MKKIEGTLNEFVSQFDELVRNFYSDNGLSSESFRRGPCLYFHKTTIDYVRKQTKPFSEWLSNDRYFHELLYATLTAWGMNRAGGGPKLKDFNEFQISVGRLASLDSLDNLRMIRIETLSDKEKPLIKILYEALSDDSVSKIMASKPFVVGSSKLLHHLIPDLFPPMDRNYTKYALQRLSDKYKIKGSMESFQNFWHILGFFRDAACKVTPKHILTDWITGKEAECPMNTSIPKVIDNALVSYAWKL